MAEAGHLVDGVSGRHQLLGQPWMRSTRAVPAWTSAASATSVAANTLDRIQLTRAKRGSKYHFVVAHQGIPVGVQLTTANVDDSKLLVPPPDAVQAVRRPIGARTTPKTAEHTSRAQGVRLRIHAAPLATTGHHPADRSTWCGLQPWLPTESTRDRTQRGERREPQRS
jgi:hypothetical protein